MAVGITFCISFCESVVHIQQNEMETSSTSFSPLCSSGIYLHSLAAVLSLPYSYYYPLLKWGSGRNIFSTTKFSCLTNILLLLLLSVGGKCVAKIKSSYLQYQYHQKMNDYNYCVFGQGRLRVILSMTTIYNLTSKENKAGQTNVRSTTQKILWTWLFPFESS